MKEFTQRIMKRLSTCPLLQLVSLPTFSVLCFTVSICGVDPPYTPHFDVPDYGLVGAQLFNMMHSLPKDDVMDRFYATEQEGIYDAELLKASGVVDSPSQWNFFELPEDGK